MGFFNGNEENGDFARNGSGPEDDGWGCMSDEVW